MSQISTVSYDRANAVATTPTTLEKELRVSFPTVNKVKIDEWLTLDPDNVSQVSTVTITAGTAGDVYALKITNASNSTVNIHSYIMQTGDTAAIIAAALAKRILFVDANANATSAAAVVTVTTAVPGTVLTFDKTSSTTVGNIIVAQTVAAVGTAIHRLVRSIEIETTVVSTANGVFLNESLVIKNYDGDVAQTQRGSGAPFSTATHPKSLDTIQTEQGVARP